LHDDQTGTFAELTANLDGIMVPEVLVLDADGNTE
jgi:hypothetical protein